MKILAVLWAVCIVGLCHGGDGDGKGVLDGAVCSQQPTPTSAQPNTRDVSTEDNVANPQPTVVPPSQSTVESPKSTTPITLDLANPDDSKVNVNTRNHQGLEHTTYTPKRGSKITSVVENGATLWAAKEDDEESEFVSLFEKEDCTIINVIVSDSDNDKSMHFEKADGKWSEVGMKLFLKKFEEVIGGFEDDPEAAKKGQGQAQV
ncbi:signal peptide containing protein [Theileria equi strain WA]|uniref:Signal peptide containing protein n=1 Tax=Theileria equi strain WA TaxID=1537102 RepID=L1LB53_THEEQ|nr:signal peptide containing protein [Theileria equi strain WA]EKX72505.1 signal peptide containing protein [Theileria equi strain WA]|eukprot:XP_004831957.1 signal peptide containing protein [Theileria equi strain WA]